MKYSGSIKLKAIGLLAVFSLNTVVGFACSIGLDLGYNSSHHKKAVMETPVQSHENSCHHQHKPEAAKKTAHKHQDGKVNGHHHKLQKDDPGAKNLPADDCCSNEVYKFNNLDKSITQQKTGKEFQNLFVAIQFICSITGSDIRNTPLHHTSRFLFPPPPDILVSIHKFQI